MDLKSTLLNKKDLALLENTMIAYGIVVTFKQLQQEAKQFTHSDKYVHKWISELTKKGWLVRLKRELYTIATMESLGTATLSSFVIAQRLIPKSYISFESALQYHSMFDQLLQTTRSITTEKHQSRTIQGMYYHFTSTQEKYYFGYTQEVVDNKYVSIATPEKALLDLLQYNRTFRTIDMVNEKLQENVQDLNMAQFIAFVKKSPIVVQRIVGFLFDRHKIDSAAIYTAMAQCKGYSTMTTDSTQCNAKWHLYYHSYFNT